MRRPGRLFRIAKMTRPPRHCPFRPGMKSLLLADVVFSHASELISQSTVFKSTVFKSTVFKSTVLIDRSPDQQVVRCAASIGIISNEVGDNVQAVGSTRGRPLWLRRCLAPRQCAARLSLPNFPARHSEFPQTCAVDFCDP